LPTTHENCDHLALTLSMLLSVWAAINSRSIACLPSHLRGRWRVQNSLSGTNRIGLVIVVVIQEEDRTDGRWPSANDKSAQAQSTARAFGRAQAFAGKT
jgi:hypothetical protein